MHQIINEVLSQNQKVLRKSGKKNLFALFFSNENKRSSDGKIKQRIYIASITTRGLLLKKKKLNNPS